MADQGYTLPADATLTSQQQETYYVQVLDHYETQYVQRTRRVIDHYETYYTYEDKGNGSFEEVSHQRPVYKDETYTDTVQDPVYRNEARTRIKYYYTQPRWFPVRTETASGTDRNARWPEFTLGENEREGQKAEVYLFAVTNKKGESTVYRVISSHAESDWLKLSEGMGVQITKRPAACMFQTKRATKSRISRKPRPDNNPSTISQEAGKTPRFFPVIAVR